MEINDILLNTQTETYIGYQLTSISKSLLTIKDVDDLGAKPLKNIPAKVSRFINKDKITKIYKSTHAKKDRDNYYLAITKDNTVFNLEY